MLNSQPRIHVSTCLTSINKLYEFMSLKLPLLLFITHTNQIPRDQTRINILKCN